MKQFALLYAELDATTKTNEKVSALIRYFAAAPPDDAAWALYFLSGRRIKGLITSRKLHAWAIEAADIPEWLFGECYDAVGDIAETIALLLPPPKHDAHRSLAEWVETHLLALKGAPDDEQRQLIRDAWAQLGGTARFVWNKLITGGFRVGVSQLLIVRAVAEVSGADRTVIAGRLMGEWEPSADFWRALTLSQSAQRPTSQPYPFFLAHALPSDADAAAVEAALGVRADWQAEWKWDGIRGQVIRRAGEVYIWSRGEELVTDRFPEVRDAARRLPDGLVLDGELLPWDMAHDRVMPFAQLQRRIGRKNLGKKLLAEVPVVLLAYDLLEEDGRDLRALPLHERRARLEGHISCADTAHIRSSPIVQGADWDALARERASARDAGVEGMMLKRLDAPYGVGRPRGDWWKWKIEPLTIDAVLIYAQRGSGKRASLYTDYTFGVWDESGTLVPFAKAYSGLTDEEIAQVDAFIRRNTHEKFGPVRTVKPELVFELAFEGIQRSSRHKSGIAVRFPRIVRWRQDKRIEDADTLATIRAMLPEER
jgi:DNA ligase-1